VREAWTRLSSLGLAGSDPTTAVDHVRAARAPQRWAAMASACLAVLILLLASFGTRAMSVQIVRRSSHALAIRRVLGADDGRILRHVLAGAGRSGLWGGTLTVFFGTLTVAYLREALGGLPTPGPLPYLAVAALLTCTVLAASWRGARAATRVPPASALQ
jgi:ABC-type lipoprotein release transport system permease subunit